MTNNIEWEELKINPLSHQDFKLFAFSRKHHLDYFFNKNYDEILYGRKIEADKFDLTEYRNLLVYSFITENIPKGSRILKIGNDSDFIINHFQYERDCYKLENPELLRNNSSEIETDKTPLIKDIKGNTLKGIPADYFDFIFSKSGFDNYTNNASVNIEILNNINRMLRPGGYAFLNFAGNLKDNTILNNSLFHLISKAIPYNSEKYTPVTISLNQKEITNDPELAHFHNPESSEINEDIISYNKLWRKKPLSLSFKTQTTSADFLKKSPAYIFHHLIKCGGSSVNLVLQDWFNVEIDREETYGNRDNYKKYKINPYHLYSDICMTSHFHYEGVFLHQRYPDLIANKKEFRIFMFIRDPLKFRVSHYYYTKNEEWNKNFTLAQVIIESDNLISKLIPCNENNYKEVLDRYFFIGIVEKMQESFDILADLANKKRIVLPKENATQKDDQLKNLSPEFLAEFKSKNYLDYLIYDYCLEKYNKVLSDKKI